MTPQKRIGDSHLLLSTLFVLLTLIAIGCGAPAEEEPMPEPAPAEPAPSTSAEPRVFFVEPEDGATVQSPAHLVFGAENFTIEPVGDGAIHENAGHLHVGVDTDCLAPGIVIPSAAPWVHFGDAQMEFDLQLAPGEHRLCLQVGDGEHRTLAAPGLSQMITITVVE